MIEVQLGTGRFADLHYWCNWRGGVPVIRVLAGRWETALGKEQLRELVEGPDEDIKLCFIQSFVKGSGIQIVANYDAPQTRPSLAGVWSGHRPDDLIYGDIILPDGRYVSAPAFAEAHPDVELGRLPASGICMSPLDLEDEKHPAMIETERALVEARRPVPMVRLSAFSEALFQLHRDRAEVPLASWYSLRAPRMRATISP